MQERGVALVTGAATGFGLLTSVELARKGFSVVATMRDPEKRGALEEAATKAGVLARIRVDRLDVTDQASVDEAAARVHANAPALAVLVNNAGFGLSGFAEDVSIDELRRQLDTNFFGAVRTTQAFLPRMRELGQGTIVNVTSGWGRLGPPGSSSYASSKWALEGWSESLHFEVRRHGVRIVLVEPGAFRTEIWNKKVVAEKARDPSSFYFARWKRQEERTGAYTQALTNDPGKVARVIAKVAIKHSPRLRYPVGADVRLGVTLRKLLPASLFEWIFEKVMEQTTG